MPSFHKVQVLEVGEVGEGGGDDAGERVVVEIEYCEICESSKSWGYRATQLASVQVKASQCTEGPDPRRYGREIPTRPNQLRHPPSLHRHPRPLRHVAAQLVPHLISMSIVVSPSQLMIRAANGQPHRQHRRLILLQRGVRGDQLWRARDDRRSRFWYARRLEHCHDRRPGHRRLVWCLTEGGAGRGGIDHAFILFRDEARR